MTDLLSLDWIERLKCFNRVFVAFSGGLDSTVLLHSLYSEPDLSTKLVAVHINHQLQPQSDAWQQQCFGLCQQWQIRYVDRKVMIDGNTNVEAEARRLRYDVFKQLVGTEDALVTAHHADDQVETFFLNLFRGAGIAGLASIPDIQPFAEGILLRPFLNISKQVLQNYANQYQLNWIEDPSNRDCRIRRNWLRHQWLPMLGQYWPSAPDNILRSISLIQQSHRLQQSSASVQLQKCLETANRFAIEPLLGLTRIEQTNVLRLWLKQHHLNMPSKVQMEHLFKTVIEAKQDANPSWHLQDFIMRRFDGRLYLLHQSELTSSTKTVTWPNFPEPLVLIDRNLHIQVSLLSKLPVFKQVEVRFRQGGERFYWRGRTRVLKKLLQEWKIPPWQREGVPLIFVDQELVAIGDHAVCDRWQSIILPPTILKLGALS